MESYNLLKSRIKDPSKHGHHKILFNNFSDGEFKGGLLSVSNN